MDPSKLTLYYFPLSSWSQRARLALEEKGLSYQIHMVSLPKTDNLEPWFMRLNPKGEVPVLQHGEKYIVDSKVITEYLEDNLDGPPLFPAAHKTEAADLLSALGTIDIRLVTFGSFANRDISKDSLFSDEKAKAMLDTNKRLEKLKKMTEESENDPELHAAYKTKLENYPFNRKMSRDEVLAALDHANQVLDIIEKKLEGNSKDPSMAEAWLFDDKFSAVDIALSVILYRFNLVGVSYKVFPTRPHLHKYYQRLLQKPSIVRVCVKMETDW